jgi:hypothetical protein
MTWKVPEVSEIPPFWQSFQKVLALRAELQKVLALPAALRKIQAMPSRRGNPFRLPALFPLPAGAEGPKRRLVILLMHVLWVFSKPQTQKQNQNLGSFWSSAVR